METMKKKNNTIMIIILIVILVVLLSIALLLWGGAMFGAAVVKEMSSANKKADAGLIGISASTWSKLQAAYCLTEGKVGTEKEIGYIVPEEAAFVFKTNVISPEVAFFSIKNKTELRDCPIGNEWIVKISCSKENYNIEANIPQDADCASLTPSFKNRMEAI
jgi:uncharacterized protein YpmB